jgi:UDP-MurNAc hydroxylase
MKISLVNHAAVRIEARNVCLLCDPWINGSVFNNGWDLLVPTPQDVAEVMAGVTHIWLSHEHPDHFSPAFFSAVTSECRQRVEVLFQATRDGRVRRYLESHGFRVREARRMERLDIGDGIECRVCPCDFYDSWIWISDGKHSVLNLNDCGMRSPQDLKKVRNLVGRPNVLLTQYSYAAWKGGRDNSSFRRTAAAEKLSTIRTQAEVLKPKVIIPFASMFYFSNVENFYLNDSTNSVLDAAAAVREGGSEPVVLFPGDEWTIDCSAENAAALARHEEARASVSRLALHGPGKSSSFESLSASFGRYRARIWSKNSRALIAILRYTPGLATFRPVLIRLTDLDEIVSVGIVDGFERAPGRPSCVAMHSNSLAYILDHENGFDTLLVNGRFEATAAGFNALTRSFSIGSLNAMGLALSPSLALRFRLVSLLLHKLRMVLRRQQEC